MNQFITIIPSPPLRPSLRLNVLCTPRRSPAERPKFFSFVGVSLPLEVEEEGLSRCASYSSTTPPFILSIAFSMMLVCLHSSSYSKNSHTYARISFLSRVLKTPIVLPTMACSRTKGFPKSLLLPKSMSLKLNTRSLRLDAIWFAVRNRGSSVGGPGWKRMSRGATEWCTHPV